MRKASEPPKRCMPLPLDSFVAGSNTKGQPQEKMARAFDRPKCTTARLCVADPLISTKMECCRWPHGPGPLHRVCPYGGSITGCSSIRMNIQYCFFPSATHSRCKILAHDLCSVHARKLNRMKR